jgi:hypothetical protein
MISGPGFCGKCQEGLSYGHGCWTALPSTRRHCNIGLTSTPCSKTLGFVPDFLCSFLVFRFPFLLVGFVCVKSVVQHNLTWILSYRFSHWNELCHFWCIACFYTWSRDHSQTIGHEALLQERIHELYQETMERHRTLIVDRRSGTHLQVKLMICILETLSFMCSSIIFSGQTRNFLVFNLNPSMFFVCSDQSKHLLCNVAVLLKGYVNFRHTNRFFNAFFNGLFLHLKVVQIFSTFAWFNSIW